MTLPATTHVPGILLFYEDGRRPQAGTLSEHLDAFGRHSRFPVVKVNLSYGLPHALTGHQFSVLVFHYSLCPTTYWLSSTLEEYINACRQTYKVAFFQDELWHFRERFAFLNRCKVDCLYSRHKPQHVAEIYGGHVSVKDFAYYLAGYVCEDLVASGDSLALPIGQRPIDVGYRGRRLPFYMGRGSQEKAEIGERFAELAAGRTFKLDIALEETDRLYGATWHRFMANCKAVLGVEGGVSVIDRTGEFCRRGKEIMAKNPQLTFDEFSNEMGPDFLAQEDAIYYRSITPRHFEAAAFRNLQILFDGNYDGLMQPDIHYVPLRKDYSNLDEVLRVLKDPDRCRQITEQTYQDLISSQRYCYEQFIEKFDERLLAAGVELGDTKSDVHQRLQAYVRRWVETTQKISECSSRLSRPDEALRNRRWLSTYCRPAYELWHKLRLRLLERWQRKAIP